MRSPGLRGFPGRSSPALGEGGFVLPVALVVLVILAMITSVGLYSSRNDFRAAQVTREAAVALAAADAGASRLVGTWARSVPALPAPGDSLIIDWQDLPDGSSYRSVVYRTPIGAGESATSNVLVRTTARVRPPGTARRTVVLMVTAGSSGGLCCGAAVKVQRDVRLTGARGNKPGPVPVIDGTDRNPPGWPNPVCPNPLADLPGVLTSDSTRVTSSGTVTVSGTPPVQEDSTITAADFTAWGGVSYDSLATYAGITFSGNQRFNGTIGPVVSGGTCDTSVDTNWGSPETPMGRCGAYAPKVHVAGSLTIQGSGQGQGLLIVDGNLDIDDDFSYYGVVIVLGRVRIQGGGHIYGALLSRGRTELSNGSGILYSSCAAQKAMAGLPPELLSGASTTSESGWFEVIG